MKIILAIERTSIEERELEFDEETMTLESLKDDIKGWYEAGVFNQSIAVVSAVHATLFDREAEQKLIDFKIK